MNPKTLTETLAVQIHYTRWVVNANLEGVTDDQYFQSPGLAGNCANWVLGHLVHARNGCLVMLGQEPVIDAESIERYRRGSDNVSSAADAVPSADLLAAFNRAQEPLVAGLAAVSDKTLDAPAPFSPGNDPDETVGSLLAGLLFHEAYHAGQLGVIRRILGVKGAVA